MIEQLTDDVKDYIGVSSNDSDSLIKSLISTADLYLCGALGADYPRDDPRVHTLIKIIANDLYTNREHSDKRVSINTRRLISDFLTQIRLEMYGGGFSGI